MASSSRACRACQRRLGDTISSFAGYTSTTTTRFVISRPIFEHRVHQPQPRRSLHNTFSRRFLEQQQVHANSTAPNQQDQTSSETEQSSPSTPTASTSNPAPSPSSDASIPWYLRVEPPSPPAPTSPHLATQEIPPLPTNPPAILLPILQHLSISIGLDNLTLLDLRDLSPPSALGANLIMIIGTARSHKHLNTSADRFCRWLRATYKLRPYADGLLGRNELKLKLRRRNRRMKLAQSVGNTTALTGEDGTGGYDSGITTGWICCNLGAVGDDDVTATVVSNHAVSNGEGFGSGSTAREVEQVPGGQAEVTHVVLSQKDQERILEDEEDEYVNSSEEDFKYRGFGSVSNAPRIVVQMFIEEKRVEMDLEGLWESRILRRERKEQKLDEDFAEHLFETQRIEEELVGKEPAAREGLRELRSVNG